MQTAHIVKLAAAGLRASAAAAAPAAGAATHAAPPTTATAAAASVCGVQQQQQQQQEEAGERSAGSAPQDGFGSQFKLLASTNGSRDCEAAAESFESLLYDEWSSTCVATVVENFTGTNFSVARRSGERWRTDRNSRIAAQAPPPPAPPPCASSAASTCPHCRRGGDGCDYGDTRCAIEPTAAASGDPRRKDERRPNAGRGCPTHDVVYAEIRYEWNILAEQPRKLEASLVSPHPPPPHECPTTQPPSWDCRGNSDDLRSKVSSSRKPVDTAHIANYGQEGRSRPTCCRRLVNLVPAWDPQLRAYSLPFFGRARLPSAKNFQLGATRESDADILVLFGKMDKDEFCLDFREPVNEVQAMGLAVAALATKRAVC
eukprot:GHVU01031276.1.p1 GENE.GHVU01031276.1~~GHVU01031276.1.p1  ORF type:complete len:388 (+),score=67.43 GHVU01031276.1:46-1164(+)